LATLHCYGSTQNWWGYLRTPPSYIHWAHFCTMITNRFSSHSSHTSLENFHHLKQTTTIADYIQKIEELMALMQMEHPGLNEQYFVSSFIAGLKDGIKHYLIPHNPQSLCDTYWKAKELEKGILHKKSLLTASSPYPKQNPPYTQTPYTKPFPNQSFYQTNSPTTTASNNSTKIDTN
jgi:hypothetical protein